MDSPEAIRVKPGLNSPVRVPVGYSTVLIHTEKGGSVEPERRGEGQQGRVQITKLGRKYQHN
jgi:hypothetical protein